MPPSIEMPSGFNVDDFLFSKLYKSVNVEGKRAINEVLQIIFQRRAGEDASTYTVNQLLAQTCLSKTVMKKVFNKADAKLLEEKLLTVRFDVSCGIRLLQIVFDDEYKKLSNHCQSKIRTLRELRNSLSHNYPIVHCVPESYNEKSQILLNDNEDIGILQNEIRELEEKKIGIDAVEELNEIKECINVKKKEKLVITEIEKLRMILHDILDDVSTVFKEDLTSCKSLINKNLTGISRAKVKEYSQSAYDEEVERFKRDPIHELITKAREELKEQYKKLRTANPCPWMLWDQVEKSSVANFYIDKIYTPLRIEGPKTEIVTEELLVTSKKEGKKIVVPAALVVSGLAGSGKTSLCLYLLHHWAAGTQEIKELKSYDLVIFVEMRTIRSSSIESYLKTQRMKKSTTDISQEDLVQRLDDLKLLFIIDGYDEAKRSSQRMVDDIYAKFPEQRVLLTTRGEFCNEVMRTASKYRMEYLAIEIHGFDKSRIKEFTDKVFRATNQSLCHLQRARDSVEFLSYVQKRAKILERLLELPLTLALMIYLWIDCPDNLSRVTTCTSLYYELFCLYCKKLKDRLNDPCPDNTIENLLLLIGKKAWYLLVNEKTVLSREDEDEIKEQCIDEGVPKEELMSAFLVYESDGSTSECNYDYSFLHKTQIEYLSAYFLAAETERDSVDDVMESISGSGLNQVILFLVGLLARKKTIEKNLRTIFGMLDKADIEYNDFNFWWMLWTESLQDKDLLWEICHQKLNQEHWKLSKYNVVSGLQLLMAAPTRIKELVIEIENGTDPYDIKDLHRTMKTMKFKLQKRYNKHNPILTELYFGHHFEVQCPKPSDELISTLHPWGHLKHFTGSLGKQEVLNYCYRVKNLRVRVDTCHAQVCLANSLKRIGGGVRKLRVLLVLNPEECDASTLVPLIDGKFKGELEVTLRNMNDKNKKWIVQVVESLSGNCWCSRVVLERSTLTFPTVLYLMKNLCSVGNQKLTVETDAYLTDQQLLDLHKQKKETYMDVNWICVKSCS